MKYLILILAILVIAAGCSSNVAKETAKGTAREIVKDVNNGVDTAAQNISEAAPLLKEDIKEGFWNALDQVGEALDIDTGKELPKPGDEKIRALRAEVDAAVAKSVVESARKIREQKIVDMQRALGILAQTIQEEVNRAGSTTQVTQNGAVSSSTPSSGATPPKPGTSTNIPVNKLPTKEELKTAWMDFSKLTDKPSAVKKIFEALSDFINSHPEYKAKAGIAGPVSKDKIGPKALAFLDKLEPGDISKPFKFMNGHVIIQLINNAADKIEVGYIYVPNEQQSAPAASVTPTAGSATSAGGQTAPGATGGK